MADDPKPNLKLIEDVDPVESVVDVLEQMLIMARSGKLRTVAIIGLCKGDTMFEIVRGRRKPFALAGMLDHLKCRVLSDSVDNDEDEIVWLDRGG